MPQVDHGVAICCLELSDAEEDSSGRCCPGLVAGVKAAGRPQNPEWDCVEVPARAAWRGLPEHYGPWATMHTRFPQVGDGRNVRVDAAGRAGESGRGGRHRVARLGRPHDRPSSPARGRGPKRGLRDPVLGRFRGAPTAKIHLPCDGRCRPLAFVVTGGDTNDCTQFTVCRKRSECPGPDLAGPVSVPTTSRVTRATAQERSAPGSAAAASRTRIRCGPTRPATGPGAAAAGGRRGGRPRAPTARSTSTATSWNGASTAQAMARHRHPLRQVHRVLRRRCHPRLTPDVGVTSDDRTLGLRGR